MVTREGTEVTAAYEEGARHALDVCRAFGIRQAILKARSPSCGVHAIYDGSFSGRLIPGEGVTARLLRQSGVRVLDEDDWCTLKKRRDEQDGRD